MFHDVLSQIKRRASGQRAYRYVESISGFHRIQASPGFRAAAHYCMDQLNVAGVKNELYSYPASYDEHYWGQQLFPEWECTSAQLELLEPEYEQLCSFAEDKISLIQRSGPTPEGGVEAELVAVKNSHRPEGYEDLDVTGKMVLIDGDINQSYREAVKYRGAVGLVTDRMPEFMPVRHRMDMGDALCYSSFWWAPDDAHCFGFVVSPKVGERLRKMLEKKPLRVRAQVDSRIYDGKMDVLEAFIPGKSDEEIVIVAHLCHPQASANDNASGAGVAMESARCLQELIDGGALEKPQRSIRFLLVPEVYGTVCHLSRHEERIDNMVAALNLDMVGENQDKCGSVLLIENPARSTPSYTGALLESILKEISQDAKNLAGTAGYALFRWATTPFSGGSDHYVFSDPTVNVPCPMVIQWPDKYYHTNQDTIDKVDPAMLLRVVLLTSTYAYYLANAGWREVVFLGQEMVAGFGRQVHEACQRRLLPALKGTGDLNSAWQATDRELHFLRERKLADLKALGRLIDSQAKEELDQLMSSWEQELGQALTNEAARAQSLFKAYGESLSDAPSPISPQDEWEKKASGMVPVRAVRGPCGMRDRMQNQSDQKIIAWEQWTEKKKEASVIMSHALYWMDGERDLIRVAELVELETGKRDMEALVKYTEMLEQLELVKIK